jgi:hypothetical protein
MRTNIIAICLSTILVSQTTQASAETWAFRRSYFSHIASAAEYDNPDLPQSRTPYRPAYKPETPGFYVRGGFRFNSTILRNGNSTDRTYRNEGFVEFIR